MTGCKNGDEKSVELYLPGGRFRQYLYELIIRWEVWAIGKPWCPTLYRITRALRRLRYKAILLPKDAHGRQTFYEQDRLCFWRPAEEKGTVSKHRVILK